MIKEGKSQGGKILEINLHGCKKRFLHGLIVKNGTIIVVDIKGNAKLKLQRQIISNINYNYGTDWYQTDSHLSTASAVLLTVDDLAAAVGLIDTHYFPTANPTAKPNVIKMHIDAIYKCAIIQEVNRQLLFEACGLKYKTQIEQFDITRTVNHYLNRVKEGIYDYQVSQEKIESDIAFVKNNYVPERLDIWINGIAVVRERYSIVKDIETDFDIPVYQFGRKTSVYNNIHSIDGDYMLRLPVLVRDKLQAWYNRDNKACVKFLKSKLSEAFVLKGIDKQGYPSDWTSFKKQLSKRKNEKLNIDFSTVQHDIEVIVDIYKKLQGANDDRINTGRNSVQRGIQQDASGTEGKPIQRVA